MWAAYSKMQLALYKYSYLSESTLIPGCCSILVNNYKVITIPNDSLNPAYPIEVAQEKRPNMSYATLQANPYM